MGEQILDPFVRPEFDPIPPLQGSLRPSTSIHDPITTLPDLIRFNARHNKDGIFCKQAEISTGLGDQTEQAAGRFGIRRISYYELHAAVKACGNGICESLQIQQQATVNDRPVALYMESDVGLFIHLAALLDLKIPVSLLA
ncbi:hypothetical protein SODALDRAFT_80192 [Sodiomyces alkalinus F11]|uniref:AMP-dependent synthetase/ligase domain-containing protein n=1 Tax=Sodiomyces alkalinus (strain CBS 110278 / VKM F-3762 / F11) TaxID=1314773 RepID=A0A3N2PL36_SODAK|nr:hypothetical protein SODALDRAFT_80192 [Sodiomyces alkalinus F11]ROT35235.1 hypothetical protein SODALDRAFT_80192 [Sodiomyces alkalinus F11]